MKKIFILILTLAMITTAAAAFADDSSLPSLNIPNNGKQTEEPLQSGTSRNGGQNSFPQGEGRGQMPGMDGQNFAGSTIDFDAMVTQGVISQETCDKIKAYMQEQGNTGRGMGRHGFGGGRGFAGAGQAPDGQQMPGGQQFPGGQQMPGGQQFPGGQQMPGSQQFPSGQQMPGGQQFPNGQQMPDDQQAPDGQQGMTLPDMSDAVSGATSKTDADTADSLLSELLTAGIITQAEYDALLAAQSSAA